MPLNKETEQNQRSGKISKSEENWKKEENAEVVIPWFD